MAYRIAAAAALLLFAGQAGARTIHAKTLRSALPDRADMKVFQLHPGRQALYLKGAIGVTRREATSYLNIPRLADGRRHRLTPGRYLVETPDGIWGIEVLGPGNETPRVTKIPLEPWRPAKQLRKLLRAQAFIPRVDPVVLAMRAATARQSASRPQ
jgi:hypothetical protein